MKSGAGLPAVRRLFISLACLLTVSLGLPVEASPQVTSLLYIASQIFLALSVLLLSITMIRLQGKGARSFPRDIPVNIAICLAATAAVQALYTAWSMVPVILFAVYPFTVFARRFGLFWVPFSLLSVASAGRYILGHDPGLALWSALLLPYSVAVGYRINRYERRVNLLDSKLKNFTSDAYEMMERIRSDDFSRSLDRVSGEEAARTWIREDDEFLQSLVRWGCRVFNARTGLILVPHDEEIGYFRMRAAAVQKGLKIREGLIPSDRGFIHITRERGGTLCVSDATSAGRSLGFYSEGTPVGSFIVKIVMDPKWGRDADDGTASGKVRCVLYFDAESANSMSLDEITSRRLHEFGDLVLKSMDTFGHLQKLTKEVTSRGAISRYAQRLTQSLDDKEIARMALEAVVDAVRKCDGAGVMLHKDGLSMVAASGCLQKMGDMKILRDESSQVGLFLRRFGEIDTDVDIVNAQAAEIIIDKRQPKKTTFFLKDEKLRDIRSFAIIPCHMSGSENPLKAAIVVVSTEENVFGKDQLGEIRTIAGMMAPALDNALQHKLVDEQSRTDGLTGLLNHRTFQIILDGKMNNVRRGYFKSLAVIMVDGDRFKDVNDTYGHPVGDEVLKEIARRLREGVRKNDAVARYGGEEFAVALDNTGEKEAGEIAEKMRRAIRSRPFATSAGNIRVTASFGFTVLGAPDDCSKKQLFEQADRALYHAKEAGRDRVVSFRDIKSDPAVIEFDQANAGSEAAVKEVKRW